MLGPPGATPGPPSRLPGGGFVSSRWVTPPMARPRETSPILLRSEVEDRYILIAVSAALWNVLVITLALLAEIGDPSREPRAGAVRSLKKRTWSLQSLQQADGPIPRLIPSMEELGWTEDDHGTNSPAWSPSKDDLDEGILRSEGFESFKTELNLASDVATSNSTDLVVFGSFFPGQAEVTWNLLQRFLSTEEERRFARKALLFLATSPEAQEEKFWKRKAALLLTLARLGADRGTLLAALLDGEDPHDDARQDALTPLLMGNTLGMEVGHLLDERQAVGDLVTLFDLHAQEGDPGRGSLDTWPASAQLCRQLFVQSCRDTRPVLMELTARALHLAEQQSPEDAMAQALARSTLDFHAPIARSLGYDVLDTNPNVGLLPIPHCETLPNTLEHFGLLLRYPSEYRLVLDWFDQQCGFLDRILAHGTRVVQAALKGDRAFQSLASGYEVKSRIKSPQSLMKKLLQGRVVNDLLGLEIIVQPRHMISGKGEMSAFAAAAGILRYVSGVENGWRVAPNSFKDYVSQPKKSGYQAIHLTLVTDFEALTLSRGGRAPCQLELHIFTQEMKAQERQGPASHASYKAFPLRPEAIMEKLGDERGVVSITEVAHHDFSRPSDAQKMEDLAHRAGFEDMDLEDLRLSRAHVDEVVSAFQDLMAANRAEPALPVEGTVEDDDEKTKRDVHTLRQT